MEQHGKKKEWAAPELVVLVRNHPEESVLAACKLGPGTSGSGDILVGCTGPSSCIVCSDASGT